MSEFVILGDVHVGARSASPVMCEHQIKFFEDELFPYMEKHHIIQILQLGDLFDSRNFSNHVILHKWKTRVFDVIQSRGYQMITLLGNHDIAAKNSLLVNAPRLLLNNYSSITVIDSPTYVNILGTNFLLVPWVCAENKSAIDDILKDPQSLYCAGHFEFAGFEMQKGFDAQGGMDPNDYGDFDLVFSGHFHTKSRKKNVLYTGVPYEMTWADHGDQKGFYIFDTSANTVKFIDTVSTLFNKIIYDDDGVDPVKISNLNGSYVKVIVVNKTDPVLFDKFISNIISQNPADLKITDIDVEFEDVQVDSILELDDTKTLIYKFVDQAETTLDKNRVKNMMQQLYVTALESVI